MDTTAGSDAAAVGDPLVLAATLLTGCCSVLGWLHLSVSIHGWFDALCCREQEVAQQTAAVAAREQTVQQQEVKYAQLQQLVEAVGRHIQHLLPAQVSATSCHWHIVSQVPR